MMQAKHISTYTLATVFTSLTLIFGKGVCQAQQRPSDKKNIVTTTNDSIPFLKSIAINIDAIGPSQLFLSDYGQIEAAVRLDIKDKYYPTIEIGYGKADASDEATRLHYKTSAPYGKIGVDWNLLKDKHDIYRLLGGFRYAFTSYKFDIDGPSMTDPNWGGESPYEVHDIAASYHWLEGVIGIDAKIWGPIHMGWTFRYRRRIAHKDGDYGNTWYVPGFGKQGGSRLGGTFNIGIEF